MAIAFHKLDLRVDIAPLAQELKKHNDLFGQYSQRASAPNSPHIDMTDIWLRYKDVRPYLESGDYSTFADEHIPIWYPSAEKLPAAVRIVKQVMRAVGGKRLGGVLITKLPAGKKIHPHTDSGWHAQFYEKYYVAVKNSPGAVFGFESGDIVPDEGDVFEFDNAYRHWVNNDSNEDRIAMIICIKGKH